MARTTDSGNPSSNRTPLMAGNWKMNLDHLQATHLVQKLDWTLGDAKHDYGAVEVAVLVPFTDLRSVQTLIEGDKLFLKHGAQDLSVHDAGAIPARSRARSWPSWAAPMSRSATASAGSTTPRTMQLWPPR